MLECIALIWLTMAILDVSRIDQPTYSAVTWAETDNRTSTKRDSNEAGCCNRGAASTHGREARNPSMAVNASKPLKRKLKGKQTEAVGSQ